MVTIKMMMKQYFLLNKEKNKNRFKLAKVPRMKFVPEIQFLKRNVISHVGQIDELLEIVHENSKKRNNTADKHVFWVFKH